MDKKAVMLVLCRRIIAEALVRCIERSSNLNAFVVRKFEDAADIAKVRLPALALVEIPERYGSPALDTLDVCEEIKAASPGCKIVLLCPEQDKESVDICIEEKRRNGIEDFLFYDSSMEYLASKLNALCSV